MNLFFVSKLNKRKGYSLVEVLFYISIFFILSLTVINTLITMTKAFKESSINGDIVEGTLMIERMSREIRQASSVASVSPSVLRINTQDEFGNSKTVQFSLSGTDLVLYENDVVTGNLNSTNVAVNNLSFTQITTATSSAVKINLSVSSTRDTLGRSHDFYNSVVLRGSY